MNDDGVRITFRELPLMNNGSAKSSDKCVKFLCLCIIALRVTGVHCRDIMVSIN